MKEVALRGQDVGDCGENLEKDMRSVLGIFKEKLLSERRGGVTYREK